jgi:hypothetical protein
MNSFEEPISTDNTIETIASLYNLNPSQEEKDDFDEWLSKQASTLENPISILNENDILNYLPQSGNYTGNRVEVFFSGAEKSFLDAIHHYKGSFEIAIHKYSEQIFSVEIGSKTGGVSPKEDALYIGHFHPDIAIQNLDIPEIVRAELIPSPGDIKGFLKNRQSIANGTLIVSAHGESSVHLTDDLNNITNDEIETRLKSFSEKYFDIFLNKNPFSWLTEEDVIAFYKKQFALDIRINS